VFLLPARLASSGAAWRLPNLGPPSTEHVLEARTYFYVLFSACHRM